MYYLLSDKQCQKPEKYIKFDEIPNKSGRNGKGEQRFENVCIYRGHFYDYFINGIGEFIFPEGTVLSGQFNQNRFIKGTVALSVGIKFECLTETNYETFEDFFKEIRVLLAPNWYFIGTAKNGGNLENAQIMINN